MSQINALEVTRRLKDRMVQFALDDNYVRSPEVRSVLERIWSGTAEEGGLASDLWVEGAFPSMAADVSLEEMADADLISTRLVNVLDAAGAFPKNRKPYKHQHQSILAAKEGYQQAAKPVVLVSAGTGAGKTESFLLPMLDDIYRTFPAAGQGVSAIILYPMNALVNDQVDRLQEWLRDQDHATFFHFTSESPESVRDADKLGLPDQGPSRFRSRKHARGLEDRTGKPLNTAGPVPQILVTNYSMLEYMLCRPQDFPFFGLNLRSMVLDEAHLYTGNLAAEIALLLRRIYEKCGVTSADVLHYATSATIGGTDNPIGELKSFASKLFGKPEKDVKVIIGETVDSPIPENLRNTKAAPSSAKRVTVSNWPESLQALTLTNTGDSVLANLDETTWSSLLEIITPLFTDSGECIKKRLADWVNERQPGPLLHAALPHSPAFACIVEILRKQGRLPLDELAKKAFGDSEPQTLEATRRILALGAMARASASAYPLLPNRIHYLIRGSEGISISLNPSSSHHPDFVLNAMAYLSSPSAREAGQLNDPTVTLTLARCNQSGDWFIAGRERSGRLEEVPLSIVLGYDEIQANSNNPQGQNGPNIRFFSIKDVPGSVRFGFDPASGVLGDPNQLPIELWEVLVNPTTGNPVSDSASFFAKQSRLQLALLAEAALMEMPAYPDASKDWKPAQGRRLLIFSDSRTEAARLGPRFTRQHELQVIRAAINEALSTHSVGDPQVIAMLEKRIREAKEEMSILPEGSPLREEYANDLERYQGRLRQSTEGEPISQWAKRTKQSKRIFEIFDPVWGRSHTVDGANPTWTQQAWERNRDRVADDLTNYFAAEFARRTLWPSVTLETAGLAEIVYHGIAKWMPSADFRVTLPSKVDAKLSQIWPDFLASMLDEIRVAGAVTLGNRDKDSEYEYDGAKIGRYLSRDERYKSMVIPLRSITGRSKIHQFAVEVLRRCELAEDQLDTKANDMLNGAFTQLFDNATSVDWLETDTRQTDTGTAPTIRIRFPNLGLRRPSILFRCTRTGQIWPRTVLGAFPGCPRADLQPTTHEALDQDPRVGRVRREIQDSPIFRYGLWAEEHSAQLDPKENKRLQNLFKQGIRNILSSTTTLELGIDIGGLNGVLMGNIPPGKANYLQRAGRAGRRADGSSLVLGFARPSPYERQVFLNFGDYLRAPLRKPTIFLERDEIVWRHIHAYFLGSFFGVVRGANGSTGAMDAFGRMGAFCGQPKIPFWESGQTKPGLLPSDNLVDLPFSDGPSSLADHFLAFLEGVRKDPVTHLPTLERLGQGNGRILKQLRQSWQDAIAGIHAAYSTALAEWKRDYSQLVQRWQEVSPETDERMARSACMSLLHQANTFFFLTVIESLGDKLVIPRYGFPIGLSRLRVAVPGTGRSKNNVREEDQFRLQRSSMLALREYVPGSKLIAGGRLITSQGLLKHWTGSDVSGPDATLGLRGWFARAEGAGFFTYSHAGPPNVDTQVVGANLRRGEMLFAKHGFTSAAWDPPKISQSYETVGEIASYSTAFQGSPDNQEISPNYAGISNLEARYKAGGEMVLTNSGKYHCGFAVCTKCGYADSEHKSTGNGRIDLPSRFEWHASLFSADERNNCWGADDSLVLRHQHLAAKQVTHLVLFDLSPWLNISSPTDRLIANTIAQCLRLAGCRLRQIDYREVALLGVTASPRRPSGCAIVLYDSVAGGSGHVFEMLASLQRLWWEEAASFLDVPDGEAAAVRRAMIRRILTSDSPTKGGIPQFEPVDAKRLFDTLLRGGTWNSFASSASQAVPVPPTPSPPPPGSMPSRKKKS
jgi:DEAD/DEAH box helicase domain-containing protein